MSVSLIFKPTNVLRQKQEVPVVVATDSVGIVLPGQELPEGTQCRLVEFTKMKDGHTFKGRFDKER